MEKDICALEEWSKIWQIHFNAAKCKVMHIGRKTCIINTLCNTAMRQSIWKQQISRKTLVYSLTRISPSITMYNKAWIIETFKVNPKNIQISKEPITKRSLHLTSENTSRILQYNMASKLQRYIVQIEKIQRRAAKMVPQLKRMTYNERLKALDLPILAYRRMRDDAIKHYQYTLL